MSIQFLKIVIKLLFFCLVGKDLLISETQFLKEKLSFFIYQYIYLLQQPRVQQLKTTPIFLTVRFTCTVFENLDCKHIDSSTKFNILRFEISSIQFV